MIVRSLDAETRQRAVIFVFFNDTATTEIYTLSLHDALPISAGRLAVDEEMMVEIANLKEAIHPHETLFVVEDRKSTRLNSSHANISYAVFCLKKKQPHHSPSPSSGHI